MTRKLTIEDLFERSYINNRGRRVVWYRGKGRIFAHLLWNHYHPADPVIRGEVIHHKNGDQLDDRIENYQKLTKAAHDKIHAPERIAAAIKANTGKECSAETRKKIGDANRGRTHGADVRARMSQAHIGNRPSAATRAKMSAAQRARRQREKNSV